MEATFPSTCWVIIPTKTKNVVNLIWFRFNQSLKIIGYQTKKRMSLHELSLLLLMKKRGMVHDTQLDPMAMTSTNKTFSQSNEKNVKEISKQIQREN